jgi:hypothetical protein
VIEKFESYLLYSVKRDVEVRARGIFDELGETYSSVIFDDARKFEGMSIRHVRRHWLEMKDEECEDDEDGESDDESSECSHEDEDEGEQEEERERFLSKNTKFECCILIDDEVLQSILDAPATPEEAHKNGPKSPFESIGYVKIVDQQHGPDFSEDYPGWMKVDLTCLWDLYQLDDLESQYPYEDPKTGERLVYTGGPPMDPSAELTIGGIRVP